HLLHHLLMFLGGDPHHRGAHAHPHIHLAHLAVHHFHHATDSGCVLSHAGMPFLRVQLPHCLHVLPHGDAHAVHLLRMLTHRGGIHPHRAHVVGRHSFHSGHSSGCVA